MTAIALLSFLLNRFALPPVPFEMPRPREIRTLEPFYRRPWLTNR